MDTSPNNRTKRKKKKEPLAPQQNKASDPLATVSPHCESHVSLMHAQEEHEPDGMPEPGATTISPPPTPLLAHEEDAPDSMPEARASTISPPPLDFRSALLRTPRRPTVNTSEESTRAVPSAEHLLPGASLLQGETRARLRAVGLELCLPPRGDTGSSSEAPPTGVGLAEMHKLVAQWLSAKQSRDWKATNQLRTRLRSIGVDVDPVESYLKRGTVVGPSAGGALRQAKQHEK